MTAVSAKGWSTAPAWASAVAVLAGGLLMLLLVEAWHAPAVQQAAAGSLALHLAALASLAAAALLFWTVLLGIGVTGAAGTRSWRCC